MSQCVLELRPRCSLTPQGARVFVGIVGGTTFGVGTLLALQGFWPVLPFAGLEVAVLVWAVRASMRAGVERETIVISERWVTITRHGVRGEHCSVFPRHWAKVKLRAPPVALHPDSLVESGQGPFPRKFDVGPTKGVTFAGLVDSCSSLTGVPSKWADFSRKTSAAFWQPVSLS